MTFLEAALDILKRERKHLHYKDITDKAMGKNLLTFVGRTPEVTMQTQLTAAVKKTPGNPFVRVKPGVFGLLRYPTGPVEPEPVVQKASEKASEQVKESDRPKAREAVAAGEATPGGAEARGRRRRGGRGGRGGEGRPEPVAGRGAPTARSAPAALSARVEEQEGAGDPNDGPDELNIGSLSAEARSAALAETGVLETEGEGEGEEMRPSSISSRGAADSRNTVSVSDGGAFDVDGGDDAEHDAGGEPSSGDDTAANLSTGDPGRPGSDEGPLGQRRRRRRRRHRGGENGMPETFTGAASTDRAPDRSGPTGDAAGSLVAAELGDGAPGSSGTARNAAERAPAGEGQTASEGGASGSAGPEGVGESSNGPRRVMSPVDAAIEILRGQPPGRGVHVRQLADAAVRRRLIHGEPNEAWRVLRAALAAEPRERLRAGQRPRVRPAGSGLFALTRRPPDMDLEKSEYVFGEARRALRERTAAALEQRLAELAPGAFEAAARVLLQREGFGPATFVKRVEGTVYIEALRGRGARPSRVLIALRPGGAPAGRRAIGELRAGIRARGQDEGVLLLAGRLAEDAIAEWKQPGPPVEVADGAALAETCVRHGVGVINATVSVDFVDADFFAELSEG